MAVVPMKKMLVCGLKKDRKGTLECLQRQGVLEISDDLQEDETFHKMDVTKSRLQFEKNADELTQAVAILHDYAPEGKGLAASLEGRKVLTWEEYQEKSAMQEKAMESAKRLIALVKEIGEQKAEVPRLEQQLDMLVPWQSFDLPLDFKGTKKAAAFIGTVPEGLTAEQAAEKIRSLAPEADSADVTVVSGSKEQTCLFIVCTRQQREQVNTALKEMKFVKAPFTSEIPAEQKRELEEELAKVKARIKEIEEAITAMASEREYLKFALDYYTMRAEKYQVLGGLAQSPKTFAITGYVPADKAQQLKDLLESSYTLAVELSDPGADEDTPVLLENNAFAAPVETIVESYSLPAKGEDDPSMVVALSYYILFGLMLSDAAYGIIMVAACAFCIKKFPGMEPGLKKALKLFLYCGISTTFWGFMFGSFFGDSVNVIATTFFNRPDIRLAPLWFEPVSIPMKMLVFSFSVGIIHLFLGLGVKLYSCLKNGQIADGIYDVIFWYMLVGGAIVYMLTIEMVTSMLGLGFTLPAGVGTAAAVIAVIGLVGIVFTSGRESKNWGKRLLKGLYGAYGITSYLSDILSYSRLLALGLATSVISTVFNKMGSMMGNSIPGAIAFILVFLIGHALNLAINALGAYVHTNRLEFVEFFGKFYEGGGRKFHPFAVHTKYYKVKEDI